MLQVLDRVLVIDHQHGRAQRGVPATLDIFGTHFPRFPVFPGVLVLGDLALLAARVLSARQQRTWVLAEAGRIRWRSFIRPGDQVDLTVDVVAWETSAVTCRASAAVGDRIVCTVGSMRMVAEG